MSGTNVTSEQKYLWQVHRSTGNCHSFLHDGYLDPAALDTIAALADLGFDEIMVRRPPDPATFEVFATELIPAVTRIPVAGR